MRTAPSRPPTGIVRDHEDESTLHAFDKRTGRELWKTDGTAAGTVLVKDIVQPVPGGLSFLTSSDPADFAALPDGTVLFSAQSPDQTIPVGRALWRTDGTAAGTVPVLATDRVGNVLFNNFGQALYPSVNGDYARTVCGAPNVRVGMRADVTLVDPSLERRPSGFASKSGNSPFVGRPLVGHAVATMVGGAIGNCSATASSG